MYIFYIRSLADAALCLLPLPLPHHAAAARSGEVIFSNDRGRFRSYSLSPQLQTDSNFGGCGRRDHPTRCVALRCAALLLGSAKVAKAAAVPSRPWANLSLRRRHTNHDHEPGDAAKRLLQCCTTSNCRGEDVRARRRRRRRRRCSRSPLRAGHCCCCCCCRCRCHCRDTTTYISMYFQLQLQQADVYSVFPTAVLVCTFNPLFFLQPNSNNKNNKNSQQTSRKSAANRQPRSI